MLHQGLLLGRKPIVCQRLKSIAAEVKVAIGRILRHGKTRQG
jgi:hypothetical protein